MRSVLQRWPLALLSSVLACGGSPPNAPSPAKSPVKAAPDKGAPDASNRESVAVPPKPVPLSTLIGVSSPFKATFRVDTTEGALDAALTKEVLLLSAKKLEDCAYASDFASHWTVGLTLQVGLSGKVTLVAEGAKAPLVQCLESAVIGMKFPSAKEPTKVGAAIMIQFSKVAKKNTSPPRRDPVGLEEVQGGVVGGILGGVLGGTPGGGYGYGIGGIGPGGGGTGYGTIGGGRYGQIGHGGTQPIVRPGRLAAKGALSRSIIARVIRRHIPRIRFCYEKQLVRQPRLVGRIKTSFTILATGRVNRVAVSGMTRSVTRCVETAIKRMQFPRPSGGGVVQVTYPFVFSPGAP